VTVLSELAVALESATEDYARACDEAAAAENAYLREFHLALAKSDAPATVRVKQAEGAAVDERCVWNAKAAVEKACRARVESLRARLSAAQSHQRFVRDQT
jgi:hypothetical protein